MTDLFLPSNIFVCNSNSRVVFLDLKRDKYLALEEGREPEMNALVKSNQERSEAASGLLHELIASGLCTLSAVGGRNLEYSSVAVAKGALYDELSHSGYYETPTLNASHVIRFVFSFIAAHALLKLGLHRAFHRVAARNQGAVETVGNSTKEVVEIVRLFRFLRPLLYASNERCLFSSLVMLEFLWSYGLRANWVFGVKSNPFAAHCWVQGGGNVFNDRPGNVAAFTPIALA